MAYAPRASLRRSGLEKATGEPREHLNLSMREHFPSRGPYGSWVSNPFPAHQFHEDSRVVGSTSYRTLGRRTIRRVNNRYKPRAIPRLHLLYRRLFPRQASVPCSRKRDPPNGGTSSMLILKSDRYTPAPSKITESTKSRILASGHDLTRPVVAAARAGCLYPNSASIRFDRPHSAASCHLTIPLLARSVGDRQTADPLKRCNG